MKAIGECGADAKAGDEGNESLALQEGASHQSGLDVGMAEEVHALHRPGARLCMLVLQSLAVTP